MDFEKKIKRIEVRLTEKEWEKLIFLRQKQHVTAAEIFRKGLKSFTIHRTKK